MADRYYIVSLTGYAIRPGRARSGNARATTTFSVLDRDYCHNEVSRFAPTDNGHPLAPVLQRRAEALCNQLNAEERANG